jgi:DNA replication protein DnaC
MTSTQTRIEEQLRSLRLAGIREALDIQLSQPGTYDELSFSERLELLLNNEITCRDNRKVHRLTTQAKFRLSASLAEFDYQQRRAINKESIAQISQLEWYRHHQNILIEGATGTGKTYLACAIGRHCCERGISVRYYRASRLFEALTIAHGDGSFASMLTKLAKTELLIIDDWGLEPLKHHQRNDLLEIMDDRHGVSSTIVAGQLPITKWHEILGDPTLADAILDRLIHNAQKLKLKGESLRKKSAIYE